jgi:hypothetical protein
VLASDLAVAFPCLIQNKNYVEAHKHTFYQGVTAMVLVFVLQVSLQVFFCWRADVNLIFVFILLSTGPVCDTDLNHAQAGHVLDVFTFLSLLAYFERLFRFL